MTVVTVVLCALIVGVSFLGQAIFGFGGGLLAIPLLSLLIGVKEAVPLALIFQSLIGLLVIKVFRQVAWNQARNLMGGMIIGIGAGVALLTHVDSELLSRILAIYIIYFLLTRDKNFGFRLFKAQNDRELFAGFVAGAFQGLVGTGGPNLVMHLKETLPSKEEFRATLLFVLSASNMVRILISLPTGLFSDNVLDLTLYSLPLFGVALVAGQRLQGLITAEVYSRGLDLILGLSAAALLLK